MNDSDETPCLKLTDVLEDELAGRCLKPAERQKFASETEREEKLRERLHDEKRAALCLSGGGIRSASFALGVLQALAKRDLLDKFNYLSTVSGGGYIGGWLSAWITNSGLNEVLRGLYRDLCHPTDDKPTPDKSNEDEDDPDPESAPIRHLRRYSNYLTPKLGFTSADTWTLVATVVRNIFLNWLMLIPILAAVLMVPRLLLWLAIWPAHYVTDIRCVWIVFIAAALLASLITAYSAVDLPKWRRLNEKTGEPEGISKWAKGRYLYVCLPAMMASAGLISLGWFWLRANFFLIAPPFLHWLSYSPFALSSFFIVFFLASSFGGIVAMIAVKKIGTESWKEVWPMLVTAAVGALGLWWVFTYVFGKLQPYVNDALRLNYLCFAPSLVMLVYLLMNFSYVGTFSKTKSEDREWWARSAGWILIAALAWAALNAVVIWGPIGFKLLFQSLSADKGWIQYAVAAFGGASGIVTALLGHSAATKAGPKKEDSSGRSATWLTVGALTFIIFLLVFVSASTSWALAKFAGIQTIDPIHIKGLSADFRAFYPSTVLSFPTMAVWWLFLGLGIFGWNLAYLINVNQFSLHAMYRSRLIRAYLGASRGRKRNPHWFTGFDPDDNIDMHKLVRSPGTLFHVVNTAINLVSGEDLAWQERMAQSFTISPLHSGSWLTGYRPSNDYALGVGLGTAITISGAAASPNMGYHSSPLVTFLMTLFNVRLGWWVGNPRELNEKIWKSPGPRHAAWPLISEAFGNTTDKFTYVNLSDGGHFENLGLYEMVLRRCHRIVVIDAGQDKDYHFEDLGNAIRKIRIDLGIDIDIKIKFVAPDKDETHLARCAVGDILYGKVDQSAPDGKLLYIKPVFNATEPVDVFNYRQSHPEFPHESTNDQWFSESQLESYRMLGAYTIDKDLAANAEKPFKTLEDFFEHVEETCSKLGKTISPPPQPAPSKTGSQDAPKI